MSWKKICAVSDIPENTLEKFETDGIEIMIANYGGGYRAFPPRCPHMDEPLCESGMLFDGLLTCSKHLWQWDMKTGEISGMAEKDLLLYDVKLEDGDIYAHIEQALVYEDDNDDEEMDDEDFFSAD
ncbi:MAG: Rieske 2Fe-2S domain-containing protein [Candidatus Thiodiazotropha sp. (ex Lucinoma annulata)]|nr:Rieske 2Fe-2S domain-containing protein [Candidatus Thiodiazotropha sp. (ex Lucinoma borealis)]MCU7857838.1 Rieske 2Fe-2S domain-containing protein [Candidatus Thiodiazotropha sp. (ex Lucinoma borealis)]MCU7864299.1 Rieske 2Fe-2S domain-containing protein [Candidatus Thiodiazotropha sp. (ex Lucinoma borealis)]MCU7868530.1 Rieske 2Fe-2S domain-containing protein [Candidatus Thiodiazotropha sp. (ex Lucinoma borealis)]MCU7885362.1 Rieske 2Fe-2S domain-containing protein [Candidatus Thiodiazotro